MAVNSEKSQIDPEKVGHGGYLYYLKRFKPWNIPKLIIKLVLISLAFFTYLTILPFSFLFLLPLYCYRWFVILLQKTLHPEWIGIMSSHDALVGLDNVTKRCDCIIVASIVFKGVPDILQIQSHFSENVMERGNSYRKLTHYFENYLGFPFWKEEERFKVEEHVRLFDYNVNFKKTWRDGEEFVEESEVLKCFGEIEKLPFPKRQSPWEILILPNIIPREGDFQRAGYKIPELTVTTADGENANVQEKVKPLEDKYFTLIYRVHHALGDVPSFLKMLTSGMCGAPVESIPKEKQDMEREKMIWKVLKALTVLLQTPFFHLKQFLFEIDRSIWHLSSKNLSSRNHFVSTERIPLEGLIQVGKALDVPLTGVFLAGLAGGVHNFLKLTGKGHPKFMRALSPIPWKEHLEMDEGMGNHWTPGIFAIPVGETTPEKRLRACKKSIEDLTESPVLLINFLTVPLRLSVPSFLSKFLGTNWTASMILSTFPGPKYPLKSFEKYPLDNIIAFIPHMRGSAGLGITFPTCLGAARCTLSIDTAIIKDYSDVQLLTGLIDDEFRIIRSLYNPKGDYHV